MPVFRRHASKLSPGIGTCDWLVRSQDANGIRIWCIYLIYKWWLQTGQQQRVVQGSIFSGNAFMINSKFLAYFSTGLTALFAVSGCGGGSQSSLTGNTEPVSKVQGVIAAPADAANLTVRARGSLAGGVGPYMEVRVNGTLVADADIREGDYQDYTFSVPPIADKDRVDIVFKNDATINGRDRNLFVESITVNGMTIAASSAGVTFDRGANNRAFDGEDVMPGRTSLFWNGSLRFAPLSGNMIVYRHGDAISIAGSFGISNVTQTFLGGKNGPIESKDVGALMTNGQGWMFGEVGHPTHIAHDVQRGKVLFTPQDSKHINATRRYDPGFAIPEKRYFYKAHWVRNVMLLDGLPYAKNYQWKHERINWEPKIVDGDNEIKVFNWFKVGNLVALVNRSSSDKSVYTNSLKYPDSNGNWALMEIMAYTGTEGRNDGKLIMRLHKDGKTWVNQNRQAEKIYADPNKRLRYFIEQNYFGNFGQHEDGVDNPLPKPQVRELYSDDSRVAVGNDATSGWQRVELRDTVDLQSASVREIQDWSVWRDKIDLTLNTGGLARGVHDLHLVVISGVDASGWDIVKHSMPIRVQVD
ncbi:MAG: hypothetical protein EON54_03090 [Alcaligenaceae bacterium]|nr:MAG: hypothetical protein EON54_03090 [Alcaligenaceae bacterium]